MSNQAKFFVIPETRQVVCLSPVKFTVQFSLDGDGRIIDGLDRLNEAGLFDETATLMREAGEAFVRPVWKLLPGMEHLYRGCGRGWIEVAPTAQAITDMAYANDFDNRYKESNVYCTNHAGEVIDDFGEVIAKTPPPGNTKDSKVFVNFSSGEACGFGI